MGELLRPLYEGAKRLDVSVKHRRSSRSASDLKAHLVLTTKYRKKVIDAAILARLTELVGYICEKWGCQVVEFNGEDNHVHLIFQYYPQRQRSSFINALKSYTSQEIRKEFADQLQLVYYRKAAFWHSAYFIASCGGVTVEVLKRYVQNQDSPLSLTGDCEIKSH